MKCLLGKSLLQHEYRKTIQMNNFLCNTFIKKKLCKRNPGKNYLDNVERYLKSGVQMPGSRTLTLLLKVAIIFLTYQRKIDP